jgi:hypothetical protein
MHGDTSELFEFLNEAFDKVSRFVVFRVVVGRVQPLGYWVNHGLDSALIQIMTKPVGTVGFVAQQRAEVQPLELCSHTGGFAAPARDQAEAHQIPQCINQCKNLGGQTAPTFVDRRILRPFFAPWP